MTPEQAALGRKAQASLQAARLLASQGSYDIGPGLSKEETEQQTDRAEQFCALAERFLGPIPGADHS